MEKKTISGVAYLDCEIKEDEIFCQLKDKRHKIIDETRGTSLITHGGFHTSVHRGYKNKLNIHIIKLGKEDTATIDVTPTGMISVFPEWWPK